MHAQYRLTRKNTARAVLIGAVAVTVGLLASAWSSAPDARAVRSPFDVTFSADGRTLAATDRTANKLSLINPGSGRLVRQVALTEPTGVTSVGRLVYAAENGAATVAEIDAATGRVLRRFGVAQRPMQLAAAPKRGLLVVTGAALHQVSVVDLASGKERARIAVPSEPFGVAISPDEKTALISNLIPLHNASDPGNSSSVSIIDLRTLKLAADIRLPAGSTAVRGIKVSPDGKWGYVVHAIGRFNLPTTQLDRGWINTNALTVLDLTARKVYASVLLDHIAEGAADPWGMALSKDGSTMWITLSGVHQLAKIDVKHMLEYMAGKLPDSSPLVKMSDEYAASSRSTWVDIKFDPTKRADLVNDLAAMHVAELLTRTPLPGNGPRGLALSPDGKRLAAAMYFSGGVDLCSVDTGDTTTVSVGPLAPASEARVGERMFHDATLCFQSWLSCATCHPDGRADGLNWDLLNDGIGNPKNTRSLLLAHKRAPVMSHGIRANLHVATVAGFRFIEFREPQTGEVKAVESYIASMKPQPSPYLVNGKLSAKALRGKRLFESAKVQCASCHNGPIFSDQHLHDVATRQELDSKGEFVTSTLIEAWRTAPYLHDGSATSMRALLTTHNKRNKHGVTSHLTPQQIDELAEYVLSL